MYHTHGHVAFAALAQLSCIDVARLRAETVVESRPPRRSSRDRRLPAPADSARHRAAPIRRAGLKSAPSRAPPGVGDPGLRRGRSLRVRDTRARGSPAEPVSCQGLVAYSKTAAHESTDVNTVRVVLTECARAKADHISAYARRWPQRVCVPPAPISERLLRHNRGRVADGGEQSSTCAGDRCLGDAHRDRRCPRRAPV